MKKKKKLNKVNIIIGVIVLLLVIIDQITKGLIMQYKEIILIPDVITLKINQITNNGYEETSKAISILTNLTILFVVFGILKSDNQFVTNKTKILLSFAFGGGVSNFIDKILRGNIVEFINIKNLPSFNIADIAILIGWVSFVAIFTVFSSEELFNKKKEKKK